MFKTLLIGMVVIASASMVAAQADDYNKLELFAGYSHNRVDTGFGDDRTFSGILSQSEGFHGVNASLTGNVSRYFGLKFDFSAHFRSQTFRLGTPSATVDTDFQLYNFLGGVQVKNNSSEATFKPFAHALVGAAHARTRVNFSSEICATFLPGPCPMGTESETGLAGAIGGGLDIRVSKRIDIRAIQFDYNPTRLSDQTLHNFRVGVGIVIH